MPNPTIPAFFSHIFPLPSKKRVILFFALFLSLLFLFLLVSIFFSAPRAVMLTFALVVVFITALRPFWALTFLLWYIPFEPFLLKFVPDTYYLYARYSSEALLYVLLFVVVFLLFSGKRRFRFEVYDVVFLLFLLSLTLSAFLHWQDLRTAAFGFRGILRFVIVYYIVRYLQPSRKQIVTALAGLFAILLFESLLGFAQAASGGALDGILAPSDTKVYGDITLTVGTVQSWAEGQRVFATLGRYERLGTWLMMFLLFAFAAWYERFPKKYLYFFWATLLFGGAALVLTYSRAAWFGVILGVAVIGVCIKRDRRLVYAAFTLVFAVFLYQQFSDVVVNKLVDQPYTYTRVSVTERLLETFSYERWRGEYRGYGRLFFFVETIRRVIPISPVFCFGPGQYGSGAAAALHNHYVYNLAGIPFGIWGTFGHIDNSWFSLWGEAGTVGILLYLTLWVMLFQKTLVVYRRSRYMVTRTLALAYLGVLPAVAFVAFLATYLEMRTLALYFWAAGGAVIALGWQEGIFRKTLFQR